MDQYARDSPNSSTVSTGNIKLNIFEKYTEQENRNYIKQTYIDKLVNYLRNQSKTKKRIVTQVDTEFKDQDQLQVEVQNSQLKVIDLKEYQVIIKRIQDHCDLADANRYMYNMHKEFIREYIKQDIIPMVKGIELSNMLERFVSTWKNFTMYAMLINRLFDYIDRNYITKQGYEPMGMWCQKLFKTQVIEREAEGLSQEIHYGVKVQELIYQDRKGDAIDKDMIKAFVQLYVDLGKADTSLKPTRTRDGEFIWQGQPNLSYYNEYFERPFLRESKN